MTHQALIRSSCASLQVHGVRIIPGGSGRGLSWAKARLIVALLAVAGAAACGGGGVSSHVQAASQLSAQVSPGSLTFGNQVVGVVSAAQTVILLNSGSAAVNITKVSITGDFSQTNNCPSSLGAGANCSFLVYFTPTAAGARTGTLSIITSASSAAQTVGLTGSGIGVTAQVSAGSLTFASQLVGTASPPQTVTLTNVGTTPFSLTTANISGDFSQTSNCPASLEGGSSCTFQIVFTPTATGTRKGALSITTTAPNILPDVNLTGIGAATGVSATHNPQVALYSVNVPEGSTVSIQFGPDTNYGLNTWSQSAPSGGGLVSILVAGMRAFTTYHMRAVVQLSDGTQTYDSDHVFTTGGLSAAQTPSLTATTTPGMTPNSGIELLDLLMFAGTSTAEDVVATDLSGNVIWYYDPPFTGLSPNPVKLLPNGHMLINYSSPTGESGTDSVLQEVDLAGNVVWQMTAADLNAALAAAGYNLTIIGTHHDFVVLPDGHLILIASTNQDFTNLTGYTGTTVTVWGDALIDLDTNRKPVWVWSEFDHLDVNRHPMNFPSDWTHTNGVIYSPSDGDLVISIRHQHWVIKIDYDNGQGSGDIVPPLGWTLGWQGDFTLEGGTDPVDWFYAQHGPSFVNSNTSGVFQMTLFDNGDNRSINGSHCGEGPTSLCYSRVPLFEINESAMTATILWQDTLPVFSFFGGNAEVLPNGNVEFDECASGGNSSAASVYEVTQDPTNPQTVWQLQITGQNAYRAIRMPSLYPGVQW